MFLFLSFGIIKIRYFNRVTGDKRKPEIHWWKREIYFYDLSIVFITCVEDGVMGEPHYSRSRILTDWKIYVGDYSLIDFKYMNYIDITIHSNCKLISGNNNKITVNGRNNIIDLGIACYVEINRENNTIITNAITPSNIDIKDNFCILMNSYASPVVKNRITKSSNACLDLDSTMFSINSKTVDDLLKIFPPEEIMNMKNNLSEEEKDRLKMMIELKK